MALTIAHLALGDEACPGGGNREHVEKKGCPPPLLCLVLKVKP